MSEHPLTESELDALTAQVKQRLAELEAEQPGTMMVSRGKDAEAQLITIEIRPLEDELDEDAEGFWQKFKRTAKRDICEEDGKLYGMWRRVNAQDVVAYSAGVVSAMGLGGRILPSAAVAVSVVMLHLGIRTLCEEYDDA
jgi:hypothetical protein